MAGIFLSGFLVTAIIAKKCAVTRTLQPTQEYEHILGGDTVRIPLERFDTFDFTQLQSDRGIKINNYKGVAVCESDTASTPWLVTREDWAPFLQADVANGSLTLCLNRQLLDDYYGGASRVTTEDFVLATVVVPRGMADNFYASSHTLYLDSIKARKVTAMSKDRIVLNDCDIDSLLVPGHAPEELKLANSRIGKVSVDGSPFHTPGEME